MGVVARLAGAGLRGRRRLGLAVTALVLAVASFGVCAGLMVSGRDPGRLDRVAAQANVADVVVRSGEAGRGGPSGLAAATLPGVAAVPGVRSAVGPLPDISTDVVATSAAVPRSGQTVSAEMTALDDPRVPVNRPLLDSGRWVGAADEIVLEHSFAVRERLRPGSTVDLRGAAGARRYRVVGTATDLTDCGYPQCPTARMFTTTAGMRHLAPTTGAVYWLDTSSRPDAVVTALLARYGTGISTNTWPGTRGDLLIVDRLVGRFVSAFGLFLLVASAVVVASSTATRMVERRRDIALLGAVGLTRRQVGAALMIEEGTVAALAGAAGWLAACLVAPRMRPAPPVLGEAATAFPLLDLLVALGLLVGLLIIATAAAIWRAARRPFVELTRDAPPEPRGLARALTGRVPGRLSLLGLAPVGARPDRAALRCLAVVVALVGGITAAGFVSAVGADDRSPARTGDPWNVSVSSDSAGRPPSPAAVEAALRATPGVAGWYTETDRIASVDGVTFRARALGGDEPGYRIGAGRLPRAPGEVALGYGLVRQLGLDVGRTFQARMGTRTLTLHVVGWYSETEDTGHILAMRLADLRVIEPTAGPERYLVVARAGVSTDGLVEALRGRLPSGVEPTASTGTIGGLSALRVSTGAIALLLGMVAGANLFASLLTSNAESSRTTGIQRALGFTGRNLVAQGFVGAAALGLAAAVVGMPGGLFAYTRLADALNESIGIGPGVARLPGVPIQAALALVAVIGCGALGAAAAHRENRRPIPDLLRWE
jgi:putative ABC transport system permease protein